jgi:hypothetical protein
MEKEPSEPKNDGHFLDEDVDRCSNDLSFERRLKSPNWFIDFPGVISIHFRLMHQPGLVLGCHFTFRGNAWAAR